MSTGMKYGVCWLLMLPVLSGCATRYCQRDVQVYEGAVEQTALQSPDGLQVPEPDPNFEIPEATGEDVPYATTVSTSTGRVDTNCLDTPPNLIVAKPPPDLEQDNEPEFGLSGEPATEEPDVDDTVEEEPEYDPIQL